MTYARPDLVSEIDDLSENSKMIKTLEIIEVTLMAIMVLDLLGRIMNYLTVRKAN